MQGRVSVTMRAGTATGTIASGFRDRLTAAMTRSGSLACVGLDPDLERFPATLRHERDITHAIVEFNAAIIEATHDLVCAYKPNLGFYVKYGLSGMHALIETRRMIPAAVPVILDCKVNDMQSTATAYARGYFEEWEFDAITANGYLGDDAVAPFLSYRDRGVFMLCKTSNPGAATFQDLAVAGAAGDDPLYLAIADRIQRWADQGPATVGMVVGATYPAELARIRARCPELPILLPGVGAQGGEVAAAVAAGVDQHGAGLIVSSSRAITYAGQGVDYAARARDATLALRAAIADAMVSAP
jgi:orotidine-5'-phosphate decarboxylase